MARVEWPGRKLLRQQNPPNITFDLISDIHDKFLDFDQDHDTTQAIWGERIQTIVNGEFSSKPVKLQGILKELVGLLTRLCFDSDDTDLYFEHDTCFLLALPDHDIDGVHCNKEGNDYTKVKLGRVGKTLIQFNLHRVVAFLSCGNPPPPSQSKKGTLHKALATHSCGKKGCLRVGCVAWGDHSSNAADMYKHEYKESLKRLEATPKT